MKIFLRFPLVIYIIIAFGSFQIVKSDEINCAAVDLNGECLLYGDSSGNYYEDTDEVFGGGMYGGGVLRNTYNNELLECDYHGECTESGW
tara:strand:+ start:112 stop:381 length:270 start_codon:yes stop_codon:yes gene_type:complete